MENINIDDIVIKKYQVGKDDSAEMPFPYEALSIFYKDEPIKLPTTTTCIFIDETARLKKKTNKELKEMGYECLRSRHTHDTTLGFIMCQQEILALQLINELEQKEVAAEKWFIRFAWKEKIETHKGCSALADCTIKLWYKMGDN